MNKMTFTKKCQPKIGDIVVAIDDVAANHSWAGIGEVPINFKTGDRLKVTDVNNGIEFGNDCYFPRTMFILESKRVNSSVVHFDSYDIF